MLRIVGHALQANDLPFMICSSAKDLSSVRGSLAPLERFKREAGLRILLLPLSLGADGLSITEANHVLLLEPLLHRATEMQAVARICRIGQTRSTYVHRYVLANTVEEKIHRTAQATVGALPIGTAEESTGERSEEAGGNRANYRRSPMKGSNKASLEKNELNSLDTLKRLFE